MIHHVGLEVTFDKIGDERRFWGLIGYFSPRPPSTRGPIPEWLICRYNGNDAIQLHKVEEATVPNIAHVAIQVDRFDKIVSQLKLFKHDVKDVTRPEDGGAMKRAWAMSPCGHMVELLESPMAILGGPPSIDEVEGKIHEGN
jgi:hypothetical protein